MLSVPIELKRCIITVLIGIEESGLHRTRRTGRDEGAGGRGKLFEFTALGSFCFIAGTIIYDYVIVLRIVIGKVVHNIFNIFRLIFREKSNGSFICRFY